MKHYKIITLVFTILFATVSCIKDLDTVPLDKDEITSASVYADPDSYRQVLAKLYSVFAMSGQRGPSGLPDISGIDEGFSNYTRQYWVAQEIPTDEAVVSWNDPGLPDYNYQAWDASNDFVTALYNRIFYMISISNEYIRETTDEKLDDRDVSGSLRTEVEYYRNEARFLRALSYWHALDLYRNVPFVTEDDGIGSFLPDQISKTEFFHYIESELKDLETKLVTARQNEYARADQAAAWMVLSKLYLNAEVYINESRYTECITYCNKIINAGYTLEPVYEHLFLADNHLSNEVIFPIAFDGTYTQSWGGVTFIINAASGSDWDNLQDVMGLYGNNIAWGGNRATKAFVEKFDDYTGTTDSRPMFYTTGHTLEIDDIKEFKQGYGVMKFKNVTSGGVVGSNGNHPDTDFPMFRLADVYLMYAEAVLRGGTGGDAGTALGYINQLRFRAYGDNSGDVSVIDLDFILDERSRELYWECHRRTDLIRYNYFTGSNYLWPWKGNVAEGTDTDNKYDLFPIPDSDIGANPNLIQNPGY